MEGREGRQLGGRRQQLQQQLQRCLRPFRRVLSMVIAFFLTPIEVGLGRLGFGIPWSFRYDPPLAQARIYWRLSELRPADKLQYGDTLNDQLRYLRHWFAGILIAQGIGVIAGFVYVFAQFLSLMQWDLRLRSVIAAFFSMTITVVAVVITRRLMRGKSPWLLYLTVSFVIPVLVVTDYVAPQLDTTHYAYAEWMVVVALCVALVILITVCLIGLIVAGEMALVWVAPETVLLAVALELSRDLHSDPIQWPRSRFKRLVSQQLELLATVIENFLPRAVRLGDSLNDSSLSVRTREIAYMIRVRKSALLGSSNSGVSALASVVTDIIIASLSGNWDNVGRESIDAEEEKRLRRSSYVATIRTVAVALLPLGLLPRIQLSQLAVHGIYADTLTSLFIVWAVVALIPLISPHHGPVVQQLVHLWRGTGGNPGS